MLGRPAHIIADEEIEQAVAVVVEPDCGRAEGGAAGKPGGFRDIDERALAGVAKEAILADAGDEQVGEAVVVVIADGDAHAVHFDVEPGGFGDVGERAVAIVVIEAERGALLLVARPIHRIDEQDVLPTVGVVVEKGAAGAECFGEELAAVGAAIVLEVDAGLRGDIDELETECRGG